MTAAGYSVAAKGQNFRTWSRVASETNQGVVSATRTNTVVQLSAGMHRWDTATSAWVESTPKIIATTNGLRGIGAGHGALFASNINSWGSVRVVMPTNGINLVSHILCLAYADNSTSTNVNFAVIRDTAAQLIGTSSVQYSGAFSGADADVRYDYTAAGISQSVLFHSPPAAPSQWGLNPDSSELLIITEFVDGNAPQIESHSWGGGLQDQSLSFGPMRMVPGRGFTANTTNKWAGARVRKTWEIVDGRSVLVEHLKYSDVVAQLASLPASAVPATNSPATGGSPQGVDTPTNGGVSKVTRWLAQGSLPAAPPKLSVSRTGPMRSASVSSIAPLFVADYELLQNGGFYLWCGSTYLVSGSNWVNYIDIEPGSIVKFDVGSALSVDGFVEWAEYGSMDDPSCGNSSIFTSANDDRYGEQIPWSNGNPQAGEFGPGLNIYCNYVPVIIQNIQFLFADPPISTIDPCSISPSIFSQPSSQTVPLGASVTFTVGASGLPAPSYQWQFWQPWGYWDYIWGAVASSYTKNNVQFADGGNYNVLVSNSGGVIASATANLTVVCSIPSITTQPASQRVAPGASATFTVSATSSSPLSYQWQFNASDIAGATGTSYTKNNVQQANLGDYTVRVANSCGSLTSLPATLSFLTVAAPSFSPVGGSYTSARNVAITVTTAGAAIHYTTTGQDPTQTDPTISSGSTVLVDHNLTLKASAWKSGYTTSDIESQSYRIEATPSDQAPVLTISPPSGTVFLASSDIDILVEASDSDGTVARIQLFQGSTKVAETAQSPLRYTVTKAVSGTYTFTVKAVDDAGFVTLSSPITYTVNASGPVLSLYGTQPFFTSSPATLVASVFGVNPNSLTSLTLNGGTLPATTGSLNLKGSLMEGANTFTLVATDNQGRTGQATATVFLDSVRPTISITSPAANSSKTTGRIDVQGAFTESSLKRITVNGVPAFAVGNAFKALNVPLALGANTITATAEDQAGNIGTATITVTGIVGGGGTQIDPVQLTASPVGGFAPLTVSFQAQSSAPGTLQQVQYDFDGDGVIDQTTTTIAAVNHAYSSAGQYFPVVTIQTTAGRFSSVGGWNSSDPARLRINVQTPPVTVTTIAVTDPIDLKWMPGGFLYVLSRSISKLTEYDASYNVVRFVNGIGSTPTGLDVDNVGNVYVAVSGDNQVLKFVPTAGSFQPDPTFKGTGRIGRTDKASGSQNGEFNTPYDVAVTPDGTEIDVSDSVNNRIQRFTSSGVFIDLFGEQGAGLGQFNAPKGLTFDEVGTLYIADSGNARIVLAIDSGVIGASGSSGSALGQFQGAVSLGAGERGIYVADAGNSRVQIFEPLPHGHAAPTPLLSRLALSTQLGVSPPNLNQPSAAAAVVDLLEEKLWIADTGNNRLILARLPADNPEAVWSAMKQRLIAGDISGAIPYFCQASAENYLEAFLEIGATKLASITSEIPGTAPVFIMNDSAQYYFQQVIEGTTITFPIDFVRESGIWKIIEY